METIPEEKTVSETVAEDYRAAEVFKKHGIDFCCGGKKTIHQVCTEKKVDERILKDELNEIKTKPVDLQHDFKNWPLHFLIDYIVTVHHQYVNNNLSLISEFAEKVSKVHGHYNTETIEINSLWRDVVDELTLHMKKEELILFPYIKNLEKYSKGELESFPLTHFDTVKRPVGMMEQEHEMVGKLMQRIEELSNHFSPPDYACNTYKVLYAKLEEFRDDLYQHIHLENNILFPKAIALEERNVAV